LTAGAGAGAAIWTAGAVLTGGAFETCGYAAAIASIPPNTVSHTRIVFIPVPFLMRKPTHRFYAEENTSPERLDVSVSFRPLGAHAERLGGPHLLFQG
jgi:hypothetical protein